MYVFSNGSTHRVFCSFISVSIFEDPLRLLLSLPQANRPNTGPFARLLRITGGNEELGGYADGSLTQVRNSEPVVTLGIISLPLPATAARVHCQVPPVP